MAAVEPIGRGPGSAAWGVAALLLATSDALAARFGALAVRGEISGFVRAASGHCYFSLKDADGAQALLRCAMFRRAASLVDFAAADGQQVELRGRLGVFESRGELQMVVESMRRVGAGTLYEEFLRRRAKLAELGLFDASRKRAIAARPQTLGVITSLGAAALADVLSAIRRRAPHVRVIIYPSLVQGAEAPLALVQALQTAGRRAEVQTLLLVRGGGSLEDLWAFNDERVVHAIAECPLPVVSGVGHETDLTLADLVADLRAPTPTAAAELAAPVQGDEMRALQHRQQALARAVQRRLQLQAQGLDHHAARLHQPARALAQQHARLQALAARARRSLLVRLAQEPAALAQRASRLQRAARGAVAQQGLLLRAAAQALAAHDPRRVLQRGYAWVEQLDGRAVVSARSLQVGQQVRAVWADGRALAAVQALEDIEAGSTSPVKRKP